MPHVSVLLMLIACLCLHPYFVLCTKSYIILASSAATALQGRNVRGHNRDRRRLGREKFSEIYMMDDVELG